MEIKTNRSGGDFIIKLAGRLDTITAPELDAVIGAELGGVSALTFDFTELEYVSSAGLRELMKAQKTMTAQKGTMVLTGVNTDIMEVLEMTGFSDILTIK